MGNKNKAGREAKKPKKAKVKATPAPSNVIPTAAPRPAPEPPKS